MCIRDRLEQQEQDRERGKSQRQHADDGRQVVAERPRACAHGRRRARRRISQGACCLLYTSDAADERSSVDLGGRRIIKKKKQVTTVARVHVEMIIADKDIIHTR